jgi:hypothetical protein
VLGQDADSGRGARCGALQLLEPRSDVRLNLVQTVSIVSSCIHVIDGCHMSSQHDPTVHVGGRKAADVKNN